MSLGHGAIGNPTALASIRPPGSAGETLSLAEQIAWSLADLIVKGEYQPGERVHEVSVAEKYHVSRGPVREALRILEREGLITIVPRRGALVTKPSISEVRDIFEIRAVLFGVAARRLATARQPSILDALQERLQRLESIAAADPGNADADAYVAAVQELTLFFSSGSGSERLTQMIFSLFHQTLRYSRISLASPERRHRSIKNWQQLISYIEAGKAKMAEKMAVRLIEESKNAAMQLLKNESKDG